MNNGGRKQAEFLKDSAVLVLLQENSREAESSNTAEVTTNKTLDTHTEKCSKKWQKRRARAKIRKKKKNAVVKYG